MEKLEKIKLKKMELVLAIEPGVGLMQEIEKKVEVVFGAGISMSVKVDKSILGGALIFFDGRYYNGSLKKKLEDYYEKRF